MGPGGRADPIRGFCQERTGEEEEGGKNPFENINLNCVILEKSVNVNLSRLKEEMPSHISFSFLCLLREFGLFFFFFFFCISFSFR